jgi:uncharacterized membrane protein (UPF0127 family)
MEITNASKKAIVCRDVELARGLFRKGLGLMFRKELRKDYGMLFEFGNEDLFGMWMFGMRISIDMVFISSDKRVTDVFHNVPPVGLNPKTWKVYGPSAPVKWVLELPAGAAKKGRISPGDKLKF